MRAKKSYGQHFLSHDHVAEQIAETLPYNEGINYLLEVGPGKGKLTQFLLKRPEELFVVEADRDMVTHLNTHFPDLDSNIILEDFLKFNPRDVFKDNQYYLIGNFPYNISSQIVFKLLSDRLYIPKMVGMFQKEVAKRIISPPGSKVYGVISVLTQAFYTGRAIMHLKPGHFNPPPKVDSSVIILERKREEDWIKTPYHIFRQIVKSSFGMRRKMMRNSLSSLFTEELIKSHEIFTLRPEKLSVQQFDDLGQLYLSQNQNH